MDGAWAGGKGCKPAVDMALEDVNRRSDILHGYKLIMVANDSQVKSAKLPSEYTLQLALYGFILFCVCKYILMSNIAVYAGVGNERAL